MACLPPPSKSRSNRALSTSKTKAVETDHRPATFRVHVQVPIAARSGRMHPLDRASTIPLAAKISQLAENRGPGLLVSSGSEDRFQKKEVGTLRSSSELNFWKAPNQTCTFVGLGHSQRSSGFSTAEAPHKYFRPSSIGVLSIQ